MNTRRRLIGAFGAGALLAPLGARAQQKVYRVGYLANDPDPRKASETFKAFVGALRELGWIEGENLEIRVRSSAGRDELFPALADEFVRENVDIIVTTGSGSTRAAKNATSTIPIVFGSAANPVEQKFIESLARPGGNVTGLAILVQELGPKRMELLKRIVPRARRIARFFSRLNIVRLQPAIMGEYDTAAQVLGVSVQHVSIAKPEDIESAFAAAADSQIDAVVVEADAVLVVNRAQVCALALEAPPADDGAGCALRPGWRAGVVRRKLSFPLPQGGLPGRQDPARCKTRRSAGRDQRRVRDRREPGHGSEARPAPSSESDPPAGGSCCCDDAAPTSFSWSSSSS